MQFGILFTSQPNTETEPYPHRGVHARVTHQVLRADELGYDYAWLAEHHFSNEYGIMPDVFVYAGYLAALTRRIREDASRTWRGPRRVPGRFVVAPSNGMPIRAMSISPGACDGSR